MSLSRRRGYIRVEDNQSAELARWDLPEYAGEQQTAPKETAFNYDPGWQTPIEAPEQDAEPAPLTAADLESLRAAAYQEGFEQGKAEGHLVGLESGQQAGHEQGLLTGHEAGLAQGLEAGQAQIQTQVDALVAALDSLSTPMANVDHEVEQVVCEVAMTLARELIKTELATNPQVILHTVREAIAALPHQDRQTRIALHPDDQQLIAQTYDDAQLAERKWQLIAEPTLNRGDVQVQSEDSRVDYPFEQRVAELLSRFRGKNGLPDAEMSV